MASKSNNTGTFKITNTSKTITKDSGLTVVSIVLMSGAGTIQGSANVPELGGASTVINLVVGQPTIITAPQPIDGLIINIAAGVANIYTYQ